MTPRTISIGLIQCRRDGCCRSHQKHPQGLEKPKCRINMPLTGKMVLGEGKPLQLGQGSQLLGDDPYRKGASQNSHRTSEVLVGFMACSRVRFLEHDSNLCVAPRVARMGALEVSGKRLSMDRVVCSQRLSPVNASYRKAR